MPEQFISLSSIRNTTSLPPERVPIFTEEARLMGEQLKAFGLMRGAGTVQIDVAVSTQINPKDPTKGRDKPLCWLHCDTEGGYFCPAQRFSNLGVTTKGLAPEDLLSQAFINAAQGLREFNRRFIANGSLDRFCEEFQVPPEVKDGIAYNLSSEDVIANIFGGEAAVHPEVMQIAKTCHDAGMTVDLTTTGDILLTDTPKSKAFLEELSKGYINTLAVTGEFRSKDDVIRLGRMTPQELKKTRHGTDVRIGQLRKEVAGAYVGQLHEALRPQFPQLLFNIVVHDKNIEHIEEILTQLKETFPHAILNPYPVQSAFTNDTPAFTEKHIPLLRQFVANRLDEQKRRDPHMSLKPHYFALLAAIDSDPRMMSGYDAWKCYENPYGISGAGRVVQVGASGEWRDTTEPAGGKLACFWNDETTTRTSRRVWDMNPTEITDHIDSGMQEIAKHAATPCGGCLFSRLTGDMVSQNLGTSPLLKAKYLAELKQIVSFAVQ